ncbi:hypothetical protein EON77_17195 [bacterium]|nr:MAG: hypothetical protein EON77_17195 [bacterium]
MILGCTGFLILSVVGYALAVWPFFAFLAIETRLDLARNVALGGIPHLVLTVFGARRFAVAGACGAAGGAAAVAVFLYLRLSQVGSAALVDQGRAPEYGPAVSTLLPCLWLAAILGAAILAIPAEKRADP